MSHCLQPHARLLCPWDCPGKNSGLHALLQGLFPTQGSNPGLLHYRQILYPLLYLASSLLPLSSAMVRQIPFPQRRESHGLLPLPVMKIFENQVAKLWPLASFTWTTLKEPGCLSWLVTTPVLLRLAPPVTMHQCQIWLNQYSFQSPSQFEWCHSPWWGNRG